MKNAFVLIGLLISLSGWSQDVDYDQVADRLINQSLHVTKGETVLIHFTPNLLDLAQAVYISAAKAGGIPTLSINVPDAERRIADEVSLDHLRQMLWPQAMLERMADCQVVLEADEKPDRWQDLKPEVRKVFQEANAAYRAITARHRSRVVTLGQTDGMPTQQIAGVYGANYDEMMDNFWKAVAISPAVLQSNAEKLMSQLAPGSSLQVTTPQGTDISFKLHKHAAMKSLGSTLDQKRARGKQYAWLPAGDVFTAIDPNSANGVIHLPAYFWGSQKFTNVRLSFRDGKIEKISADQDASKIREAILSRGADMAKLSSIDLGINPASKQLGDYRSFEMAGMVSLGIGDNAWAGGDYDGGREYHFHLADATLKSGGRPIIQNGQLQ